MDEIFFEINILRTECVKFIEEQNVKIDALKEQWLEKYCPIKVGDKLNVGVPSFHAVVNKVECKFTDYGNLNQRIFWVATGDNVHNKNGNRTHYRGSTQSILHEGIFKEFGFYENN